MKVDKKKLDYYMAKSCMSTNELSSISGIAKVTISNRLGRTETNPKTVGKIAKALGVDVKDILED